MSLSNAVCFLSRNGAAHGLTSLAIGSHLTVFTLHRPESPEHRHKGTSPQFLREALKELREAGFQFVSLEDVLLNPAKQPAKSVCITMDDGYADQAELLAPILAEYDTKATFFLITDFLDQSSWPWDEKIAYIFTATEREHLEGLDRYGLAERLAIDNPSRREAVRRALQAKGKELKASEIPDFLATISESCGVQIPERPPRGYQPMSWEDARNLEQKGIRFAPHSCSHHITSRLNDEEAKDQFVRSWQRLKQELQDPVKIYCYPTGRPQDFAPHHETMLAKLGYLGAVSFTSKPLRLKNIREQRFRIPRIGFPSNMKYVFRYASWVEALRSLTATR